MAVFFSGQVPCCSSDGFGRGTALNTCRQGGSPPNTIKVDSRTLGNFAELRAKLWMMHPAQPTRCDLGLPLAHFSAQSTWSPALPQRRGHQLPRFFGASRWPRTLMATSETLNSYSTTSVSSSPRSTQSQCPAHSANSPCGLGDTPARARAISAGAEPDSPASQYSCVSRTHPFERRHPG